MNDTYNLPKSELCMHGIRNLPLGDMKIMNDMYTLS